MKNTTTMYIYMEHSSLRFYWLFGILQKQLHLSPSVQSAEVTTWSSLIACILCVCLCVFVSTGACGILCVRAWLCASVCMSKCVCVPVCVSCSLNEYMHSWSTPSFACCLGGVNSTSTETRTWMVWCLRKGIWLAMMNQSKPIKMACNFNDG